MISEERIRILEDRLNMLEKSDRYTFEKKIQILDGRTIQTGTRTGTMIAIEPTQKLGFFGTTPDSQQLKANHNNWASLTDIINALVNLGFLDQN